MSSQSPRFVCGQFGSRDHYQLPVAVGEMGRLECFFTDLYAKSCVTRYLNRIGVLAGTRFSPALDPALVKTSWLSVFLQKVVSAFIRDPELQWLIPDRWLAKILERKARRKRCHILTYEPWVVRRPPGGFPSSRKQLLFYFHPHVSREDEIYLQDQKRYPEIYRQVRVTNSPYRKRTVDAWKQADMILCASTFTRDSLVAAGMPEKICRVIPYGVKPPAAGNGGSRQGPLKLLFVGRNPLRKGLHHLLLAWQQAQKRNGDRLTIVCPSSERSVRELAAGQVDVVWKDSVSGEELTRMYREADALVVPSLCEGFGHVYLEAMGHGCAAVGTAHSALPDLGGEREGVFLVPAGAPEKLAELIGMASTNPGIFRSRSEAARKRVGDFTWEKFREGVKAAARELTG